MSVLLDTNIVLDYLGANRGFTEDAEFCGRLRRKCAEENGYGGAVHDYGKGLRRLNSRERIKGSQWQRTIPEDRHHRR